MRGRSAAAIFLLAGLLAAGAQGEPLAPADVPAPLAPWVDWVLRGTEEARCPFVHASPGGRQCLWPSRLLLEVDEGGGTFSQEWRVYREGWVPIPGDARVWPQDVRVDGSAAVAIPRGEIPAVRLGRGRYVLTGRFRWSSLPESLQIPAQTGLLALVVRRESVQFPQRDPSGRLWLRGRAEAGPAESRLEVVVHRRVVDEVPLLLDTSVELRVSGQSREVLTGAALPPSFLPMSLDSPLPARIESDGRLRVQVRPGTWTLQLLARHPGGPVEEIALPEREEGAAPWDDEEVWVFDARHGLRLVQVEGAPGIDPQQTRLPEAWKRLPAYLMKSGTRMRLVEKRRGDEDPAPDRLTLRRTWWLDFDGGGYTVHDRIGGTWSRSWRLEAPPPTIPGRVSIDGRDQLISRIEGTDRVGVEIRQGQADIEADSRLEGIRAAIPAVGWGHDFQEVSGQLNLPPGWRLLHASGVDDVRATWVTQWSLLEIFLVVLTAMIVAQLYGWRWGGLSLVTLTLIYLEVGAPRWAWLGLLATRALLTIVPRGRLQRATRLARLVAIAVLAAVAIPFVVHQARVALYPALELSWLSVRAEAEPAAFDPGALEKDEGARPTRALETPVPMSRSAAAGAVLVPPAEELRGAVEQYYAPDPLALVSTGPGLPAWGWRAVELSWRGPVQADQQIRLLLVPPGGNFLLAWMRIALTALLVLCVLDLGGGQRRGPRRSSASTAALVVAFLAPLHLGPASAAADIPTPELLDELRARLLDPPECFPLCAASPRMRLHVTPTRLRARIEIDAAWETAVPLPGGVEHWLPETVLVDGVPAPDLSTGEEGRLQVPLTPGKHQLILEGPLPNRDTVQIPLPMQPHRVDAEVTGWVLDGIREDGRPDPSLQLSRERDHDGSASSTPEPQELPPFVRVERLIRLGLSWQVETRVTRATPPGRALFVELPLVPGESVTSEEVRVIDGKVRVAMAPEVRWVRWTSALEPAPGLRLVAPDTVSWTEVWRLDVAPTWHAEVSGIPVVHAPTPQAIRIREWRPWPGEEVQLRIVRPESVEGRTLTIDRAHLLVRPGLRASESTLNLSVRASRGLQHIVLLPDGAELQSVSLDGALQPIRAVDGRVALPIRPGKHAAELLWHSPEPITIRYETAAVDPGAPSVNAEIEVAVPADRWVLLVGGPLLGPAVLFWSLLVVALLLAVGLGRSGWTPLRWASWFLLFVGLSQVSIWLSLVVVGWLFALAWRRDHAAAATPAAFDALQILLALWTVAALAVLVGGIQQGLLGLPDMQIGGNGSTARLLRWYQDRSEGALPTAWVISIPLGAYRLAMLAWALWLARALVGWLRWGWGCFSHDGIWRPLRSRITVPPPPA